MGDEGGQKMVPINQLSLQDLTNIQKQVDQELEFFGSSFRELRMVEAKFRETGDAVKAIKAEHKDKEILVPLTSSMYARGTLSSVESVLVDIGTGYLADMPLEAAAAFFERKQAYLNKQMETIQGVLLEKQRTKSVIMSHLETKVQEKMAQQQSQGPSK